MRKKVRAFSALPHVLKLYLLCCRCIAISIIVLPLVLMRQVLAVHNVTAQLCFLPLFARMHLLAKMVIYTTIELFQRIPHVTIGLVCRKRKAVKQLLFLYL